MSKPLFVMHRSRINEIADYYASKEREARELEEKLRLAREIGATPEDIKHLERLLEAAYYVGD